MIIVFAILNAIVWIVTQGLGHLYLEGNTKWLKENGVIIFVVSLVLNLILWFVIYGYLSKIDQRK